MHVENFLRSNIVSPDGSIYGWLKMNSYSISTDWTREQNCGRWEMFGCVDRRTDNTACYRSSVSLLFRNANTRSNQKGTRRNAYLSLSSAKQRPVLTL